MPPKSKKKIVTTDPMAGIPPVAYGYARVSTNRQKFVGYGEEAQYKAVTEYYEFMLKRKGVLWGEVYSDDYGVSARLVNFDKRPAARVLISRLRQGDHLIFSALDRGWRNMRDMVNCIPMLMNMGVTLHFVRDGLELNLDKPMGKLIAFIMGAMAEFESDLISQRTTAGIAIAKSYGGGSKGKPYVKFNTRQMDIIRYAVKRLKEGATTLNIAKQLYDDNIPWSVSQQRCLSRDMIRNYQRKGYLDEIVPGPYPEQHIHNGKIEWVNYFY